MPGHLDFLTDEDIERLKAMPGRARLEAIRRLEDEFAADEAPSLRVGDTVFHEQLRAAVKADDFSAAPPEVSVDAFRELTGRGESITDKFARPVLEGALPAFAEFGVAVSTKSPALTVTAGALAAAAGRGIGDIAESVENAVVGLTRSGRTGFEATELPTAETMVKRMSLAGEQDAILNLGIRAVPFGAGKVLQALGAATGLLKPSVAAVMQQARNVGLKMGASDLNVKFYDVAKKVLLVFPIIGGPGRKQTDKRVLEASFGLQSLLDAVGPVVDFSVLAKNMSKEATRVATARWRSAARQYAALYQKLRESGDPRAFSSQPLKDRVGRLLELDKSKLPRSTRTGEPVADFVPEFTPRLEQALRSILDMPEFITGGELREIQKRANRAARGVSGNRMRAEDFRALREISSALSESLSAPNLQVLEDSLKRTFGSAAKFPNLAQGAQDIVSSIRGANAAWANYRALEETAVAYMTKQIDKNFFRAGFEKPGRLELDQLAELARNNPQMLKSPDFIKDFDVLFGRENRKMLARSIIEDLFNPRTSAVMEGTFGQFGVKIVDAKTVRELAEPFLTGRNTKAFDALLEGTGVRRREISDFLDTLVRQQASPASDPATFLARGAILGRTLNPKEIAEKAVGGAAVAAGGLMSIGIFVIAGNLFARLITTPGGLKVLREGMQFERAPKAQAMARLATRLQRAVRESDMEEEDKNGTLVQVYNSGQEALTALEDQTLALAESLGRALTRTTDAFRL